jgi:hypothetical protein
MAKRKKAKKVHRRRRMGSTGIMQSLQTAGGVVAGAVLASFVNSAVKKSLTTAPALTGGAIGVLGGIMLPKFMHSPIMQSVGNGMIAAGGLFMLNDSILSIPGISGVPNMPMVNATKYGQWRKVGAGPGYMTNTVGRLDRLATVGALYDN